MTVLVNPPFQQQFIRRAEVTLTNAQIKTLPTIPFEIVAAPGAGKVLHYLSGILATRIIGAYTNIGSGATISFVYHGMTAEISLAIINDAGFATSVTDLLTTSSRINLGQQSCPDVNYGINGATLVLATSDDENKSFDLICISGASNLTGGNVTNSMKVTLYYTIENL